MKALRESAIRVRALLRTPTAFPILKLRILYRPRSVSAPVMCIRGPSKPRPLPYTLLGGILGVLWGGRDKEGEVPLYIKQQLLKAQRALRTGEYELASEAYHKALHRLASSEFAEAQPYIEARAVVLDKLANMYLEQGLLDEAEVSFKEAMKFMLRAGVAQESEEMVEISLKLSKIYTNQGKHDLAEVGFSWCVSTAEQLCSASRSENNLALWGMCLHSKGQYHLSRNQWSSAVLCLREALTLAREVFHSSHLQVAVMHNDLATALDGYGEYDDAESHARTSLEIMSHSHSTDGMEYVVRTYYNLGLILLHQGKTSEAREVLEKALIKAKDRPFQRHIQYVLDHQL